MTDLADTQQYEQRAFSLAWKLLSIRLGSVLVFSVVTWLIIRSTSQVDSFPPSTVWATLGLLPVNVVCLWLVRKFYRDEGTTLREALGVRPGRIGRDILWGFLWLCLLNIPFIVVVSGTVLLMYGADAARAFETIFFDASAEISMSPAVALMIAAVSVVPFMLINAPTEELVFRGYALQRLAHRWGGTAAILCTSLLFGAQHIFFAATTAGMVVYFFAFTVWGLIAAIIVRRQGRLFPVVIAHWIVNIMLSAPAIVFPVLQLAGVMETF